jgi:hypothetical protein
MRPTIQPIPIHLSSRPGCGRLQCTGWKLLPKPIPCHRGTSRELSASIIKILKRHISISLVKYTLWVCPPKFTITRSFPEFCVDFFLGEVYQNSVASKHVKLYSFWDSYSSGLKLHNAMVNRFGKKVSFTKEKNICCLKSLQTQQKHSLPI